MLRAIIIIVAVLFSIWVSQFIPDWLGVFMLIAVAVGFITRELPKHKKD